jgi:UDP-N-acetylglucosamine 2-epimerase (non-hydrolysing)
MIDTLICETKKAEKSQLPARFNLKPKQFAYVTLHRPSNVDEPRTLRLIMKRLANISKHFPVIFPVHPRTRKMLQKISFKSELFPRFLLIDPVSYRDSLWLAKNALFVLTDSGGLQEETTYFKTPCLTLRPNTERPITIRIGTNRLTSIATLEEDIDRITQEKQKNGKIPKYWDGRTAERIVQCLVEYSLPESF